ncbi:MULTISPECIES: hypothetical protein [unclassified Streptomyces]|uniref:hypothetical protein n=1 Tax=unclassified Streptomyces TaxID=2593676 RepID=UPI0036F9CF1D
MNRKEGHHDAPLAEILLSNKVGVSHIRYVGDVISARAQLSMGMQGAVGLSLDQRADIVESVLALEDLYRQAWDSVTTESDQDQRIRNLENLEHALREAAKGIREIASRNGVTID